MFQVLFGTLTKLSFRRYFHGSELVVAGKLKENVGELKVDVTAVSVNKTLDYSFNEDIKIPPPPIIMPPIVPKPSRMERVWAYLTIQQLLDDAAALDEIHDDDNYVSPQEQQALDLALEVSVIFLGSL